MDLSTPISYQGRETGIDESNLLVIISSLISLLATTSMILLYILFPNLRKSSRGYLLMINLCDFFSSLCFLLSAFDIDSIVGRIGGIVEGFLIQFFYLSSFCWTTCYSIHLLQLVVYHNEIPAYHWSNQLVAWTLPTISIIGLFILKWKGLDIIGNCNRVWPWINSAVSHSFAYQMGFLYIPIVLLLFINLIMYVGISFKSKDEAMHRSILFRCVAYFLVPILSIGWSGVDRVYSFFRHTSIPYPFDIISLTVPLLGFLNVCAYSLNKFFFTSFKRSQIESLADEHGNLMEETIPFTVAVTMN